MASTQTPTPSNRDEQSLAALKNNGIYIVGVIVVALAAYFGWNYYKNRTVNIDSSAADAYVDIEERAFQLDSALQNPDLDEEARLALNAEQEELDNSIESLIAEHGNTIYAWQALMLQARQFVDAENYTDAAIALERALVIDLKDAGLAALTRLRYASALLGAGEVDAAMTQASQEVPLSFEATQQELLGDIYKEQGNEDKAIRAYENAWSILLKRNEERAILKIKMENLGLIPEPMPKQPTLISEPTTTNNSSEPIDLEQMNIDQLEQLDNQQVLNDPQVSEQVIENDTNIDAGEFDESNGVEESNNDTNDSINDTTDEDNSDEEVDGPSTPIEE